MSQVLLPVTVHYHTNIFTPGKNIAIGCTSFAGLTLLVIGILAYLHIISGIPTQGAYAMMGVGGGLALASIAALIVLIMVHCKAKKPLENYLADEELRGAWWSSHNVFKNDPHKTQKYTRFWDSKKRGDYDNVFYGILQRNRDERAIHLFSSKDSCERMEGALKAASYETVAVREDE